MSLFSHRQHRIFTVLHIFASLQTTLKAIDKLSHEKYLIGGIIAGLALLMILFTLFHNKIESRAPMALPLFFIFEAIVLGIVAWLNWDKGYFYLNVASSALYIFAAVRLFMLISRKRKEGH